MKNEKSYCQLLKKEVVTFNIFTYNGFTIFNKLPNNIKQIIQFSVNNLFQIPKELCNLQYNT